MGAFHHFSTDQVAARGRLDYWNECAAATFAGMRVDAACEDFSAEMTRWQMADVVMARPRSRPAIIRRAGYDPADGEERLILHVQRRGLVEQCQRGRTLLLTPGDISLCTTGAPLRISGNDHEMLVVQIRRSPLAARLPDLDARLCAVLRGTAPAARLLSDFILSLWREGEAAGDDPVWEGDLGEVIYDLLVLALRPNLERAETGDPGEMKQLHAMVESRLGDPDLDGRALAVELGVSLRWVQHLFARCATTPRAYILDRRLERAAERLAGQPPPRITDLAFDLGFNDSAYFARCFRRRFGLGPKAWAERGRASR